MMTIDICKAAEYAESVVNSEVRAPKYVKLQCAEFLRIWNDEDEIYIVNKKLLKKMCKLLRCLKMAKGPRANETIYDALVGYQWLLITAVLCTVYREDNRKRRYETALLEI